MAIIGLNKISPSIRNKILTNKLADYPNFQFGSSDIGSEYIVNNDNKLSSYHNNLMAFTSDLNVSNSSDGYEGNVRRLNYGKQWDKGRSVEETNIWDNIEVGSKDLVNKWNDSKRNEYNNYIDYVNDIFGSPSSMINVLGGLVGGEGAGLNLGNDNSVGVVSNFDIEQTLSGRIYSTVTGNDTPLGKFGMKAAAISMANRTISKTQNQLKETINSGVDWLTSKLDSDEDNDKEFSHGFLDNSITVEKETEVKKIKLFGKEIPLPVTIGTFNNITELTGLYNSATKSRLEQSSSIKDAEQESKKGYVKFSGNRDDISQEAIIPKFELFLENQNKGTFNFITKERNDSLIENTGKMSVNYLYNTLYRNKYQPEYNQDANGRSKRGLNPNSNYLENLVASEYINDISSLSLTSSKTYDSSTFSWMERRQDWKEETTFEINKYNYRWGQYDYDGNSYYGDPNLFKEKEKPLNNTLLYKTEELFRNSKIKTIISAFGQPNDKESFIQSASHNMWGISKGRNLLKESYLEGGKPTETNLGPGYDDPYCRVWTWHKQYRSINDLIRPFEFKNEDIDTKLSFIRPNGGSWRDKSSLRENGFVQISPYSSKEKNYDNPKNYMFSIENLAWKDINLNRELNSSQIGNNDGRIMWFAPYNLKFSESVSVSINKEDFIGRGEPVLSYINTIRQGNLSFTLMVDHSSIINYAQKETDNDEQALLRWNAGCGDILDIIKPTPKPIPPQEPVQNIKKEKKEEPKPITKEPEIRYEETKDLLVRIFFPNDYSGVDHGLNAMEYIRWGKGSQIEMGSGPGYEMGGNITLSNVDKNSQIMTDIFDGSTVKNVKCNPINNNVMSNDGLTYKWKQANITKADLLSHYDKTNGEKFARDAEFLPRKRYNSFASYWDVTNEGLNVTPATGDKGISFKDFYDKCNNENTEGTEFYDLIKNAKQILFLGSASSHGNQKDNIQLAKLRAQSVKKFLSSKLKITMDDENKYTTNQGEIVDVRGSTCSSELIAKQGRFVDVWVVSENAISVNLPDDIIDSDKTTVVDDIAYTIDLPEVTIVAKLKEKTEYNEEKFFFKEYDKENDLLMSKLKDKIQYFIPGLHSTTPEGFNMRLGFLHQCTRQGPTNSSTDNTNQSNATNLSFGRPPICILRLGDFYNTKIFIETMNIDYESQWDLNPEGIGIQPMMAHISLSFYFMGGQDIGGAINRLQNAITDNFYANQSVYSDKADYKGKEQYFNPEFKKGQTTINNNDNK